ncbi:hypothetical protein HPB51_022910 [Rhipicephalus microplus]|uniref:HAT C-terminal dimerisation domain-containing protein n=1 Tax=Rhipicephalus microplus TaxID=6941 RepID=A0A9J6ECI5_RHIMP|nr:hypothetical protein HPB51_022910 [Rhipicephalus microplus]
MEFDKVNRLFQSENPDPVKLFEDLELLVKSMLLRVALKEHAFPTAEWEKHLLHVRACNFGTVFLDALHNSTLSEEEKDQMLVRCREYLVSCVKSLLKRLPSNLELFENFKFLRPCYVRDASFSTFHKVISMVTAPCSTSILESEYVSLQAMHSSLALSNNVSEFWRAVAKATNSVGEALFPNLSAMVFALLCLPASNAAVERVFSLVTVTKTDHRNKLTVRNLEMILHVRCGLKEYFGCCNNFKPSERAFWRNLTVLSCMRCNTFLEHRIVRDDVQYFPSLALHQFTCNHKEVGQCFSVSSVWQQVVCTARYAVFSCMSHVSCIYTEVSIFLSLCYQFGSKSCAARCVFSFLLYLHGCVFRRNSLSFFLID